LTRLRIRSQQEARVEIQIQLSKTPSTGEKIKKEELLHLFEVITEVAPGAEGGVADGAHVVTDPTTQISNKLGLQGCGSVSGSVPDSIGSVDPDSESGSGSGSRRAKMTQKRIIFFFKFMF
jgi:hypothetical protein